MNPLTTGQIYVELTPNQQHHVRRIEAVNGNEVLYSTVIIRFHGDQRSTVADFTKWVNERTRTKQPYDAVRATDGEQLAVADFLRRAKRNQEKPASAQQLVA